jgi:D-proline reductase (dithiol) PrdB
VGLVAREIEGAGVPTVAMTSAWDITAAVLPPRAVYLHYPLGHQSGKPGDLANQVAVVRAALAAGVAITRPGDIVRLPFRWDAAGDAGWEERAYTPEHTPVGPDGKPARD